MTDLSPAAELVVELSMGKCKKGCTPLSATTFTEMCLCSGCEKLEVWQHKCFN